MQHIREFMRAIQSLEQSTNIEVHGPASGSNPSSGLGHVTNISGRCGSHPAAHWQINVEIAHPAWVTVDNGKFCIAFAVLGDSQGFADTVPVDLLEALARSLEAHGVPKGHVRAVRRGAIAKWSRLKLANAAEDQRIRDSGIMPPVPEPTFADLDMSQYNDPNYAEQLMGAK